MYCYNCGSRIEPNDHFCAHCGVCLGDEETPRRLASKYFDIEIADVKGDSPTDEGYVLTDSLRLAERLSTNVQTIKSVLEEFVSIRATEGVRYNVLDLHVSERQNGISWQECQRFLTIRYHQDLNSGKRPVYLFIIGGDDIIPMPTLPLKINNDDTVDSDLPYAYLYGAATEEGLLNLGVFERQIMLLVGRLPVAQDALLADFINMLNNALYAGYRGLPRHAMHAQCDPNWKVITRQVTRGFEPYLPCNEANTDYYYGPIMLTPQFEPTTPAFQQSFPYKEADIFYYNLHGTNLHGVDNFAGYTYQGGTSQRALCPRNMAAVANLNIVVTEACYGGWFKQSIYNSQSKKKEETILLSSLNARTVSYLGSSRVAYGNTDKQSQNGLLAADILAHHFLSYLYQGYTAGEAMHASKIDMLNIPRNVEGTRITVLEFNLFGDPSLYVDTHGLRKDSGDSAYARKAETARTHFSVEYEESKSGGLLETVRRLVDHNFKEIDQYLQRYLYDMWNIEKCALQRVVKASPKAGVGETAYLYLTDNGSISVVTNSESHKVTCCLFEK